MNIILFDKSDYYQNENSIRLSDYRFNHISSVLKSKKNNILKTGLINGNMGTGKVLEITDRYIDLSIELDKRPPSPLPLTILLAMPRPKILKRTLKHITVLGIKTIYLINSFRVEKSYWQTPGLKQAAVRKVFLNALEQACDTVLPELHIEPLFKPFVEDRLPEIIQNTVPVVAHPKNGKSNILTYGRHVTLAIGPEGGFIPYEINKLKECGFEEFKFGERILPVETAVPSLIPVLIQ